VALAGDDGAELDSLRGDVTTDSAAGRSMVMLLVTAGCGAATAPSAAGAGETETAEGAGAEEDDGDEGEKEAYLRSLPRPESGRGPATVSSHSWSRRPMHTGVHTSCAVRASFA